MRVTTEHLAGKWSMESSVLRPEALAIHIISGFGQQGCGQSPTRVVGAVRCQGLLLCWQSRHLPAALVVSGSFSFGLRRNKGGSSTLQLCPKKQTIGSNSQQHAVLRVSVPLSELGMGSLELEPI